MESACLKGARFGAELCRLVVFVKYVEHVLEYSYLFADRNIFEITKVNPLAISAREFVNRFLPLIIAKPPYMAVDEHSFYQRSFSLSHILTVVKYSRFNNA